MFLRQSTQQDILIGPVFNSSTGALKSDLAYNAEGIACSCYKSMTRGAITLANGAGDEYFRVSGGSDGCYLLTLSATDSATIGRFKLTLLATGYNMVPFVATVLDEAVYDVLFGTTAISTLGGTAQTGDSYPLLNTELADLITTVGAAGAGLTSANIGQAALVANNLDHLCLTPTAAVDMTTEVADGTVISRIISNSDTSLFVPATSNLTTLGANVTTVDDYLDTELGAITAAVITNAAGADIAADIIAMQGNVTTIMADTDLLDDVSGGLADIHTDIGAVKSDTAAILLDTGTDGVLLAAAAVDAIWDEDVDAAHQTTGTAGKKLDDAGAAGDPWNTVIPGAYGAGTAGLLLGTTIPNAIDAIDNYVDSEVGALTTELAKVPKSDSTVSWNATAKAAIAVAFLDSLLSAGDADALNARTVRSALRLLRNKVDTVSDPDTMHVKKENDTDDAWTATLTSDAAAEPITSIDPA